MRWVGLGTIFVVVAWIAMSLVFAWYVGSVANFKTAAGQLTVFLVLTTYAYAASITFLVGVQADELMRKGSRRRGGCFPVFAPSPAGSVPVLHASRAKPLRSTSPPPPRGGAPPVARFLELMRERRWCASSRPSRSTGS